MSTNLDQEIAMMDLRMRTLEKIVDKITASVESIDESLKTLVRLDILHDETRAALNRAFIEIAQTKLDHETRIRLVESDMPTMRLVRNWVVAGVVAIVAMVGVATAKIVPAVTHHDEQGARKRAGELGSDNTQSAELYAAAKK